jgi:Fe-S cluster biogenesis protein NfuA/nitrite reductase/ring-hydroxylating ferredoxin subunit
MDGHDDVRAVGERVERLLGELRDGGDPRAAAVAEELVGAVVQLYGAGLERVLEVASADDGVLAALVGDPLVESLLLVHDLHPLDADARIQRALDRVRPYLGSHAGGVDYLGVDGKGVVHLRLEGSCNGCASSTETVRLAIAQAIEEAAPETTGIDVEGVATPQPLLQIGRRPGAPTPAPAPPPAPAWVRLTDPVPATTGTVVVSAAGTPVLVCRLGETLYAYRNACPACRSTLGGGHLDPDSGALRCPGCGARYDARIAGAGLDDPGRHLVPVPLLVDDAGVRVAVADGGLVGSGVAP